MVPAFFAATAAAAGNAFATIALSVADDAARPAASWRHPRYVLLVAGGPVPAAAEVFADLFLAARTSFPAVSGTSGPAWDFRCWEDRAAQLAEAR